MDLKNFIEFHSTHMIALLTKMGIYKTPKEAYHGLRDNLQSDEDLLKLKDNLSDVFNEQTLTIGKSGVIKFDTVEAPSVKEFKQLKKDHKALVKRVEELEGNKKRAAIAMESYWTKKYPDSPMAKHYKNKE